MDTRKYRMQKLNKELLGSLSGDDDEMLEEYE